MFIPAIQITKADRKRLGEYAQRFFGNLDSIADLTNEAARMMARHAPWADIRVAHFPSPSVDEIRLAVFVDFRLDHAMFFAKDTSGDA